VEKDAHAIESARWGLNTISPAARGFAGSRPAKKSFITTSISLDYYLIPNPSHKIMPGFTHLACTVATIMGIELICTFVFLNPTIHLHQANKLLRS
jgi:hypothetical protein